MENRELLKDMAGYCGVLISDLRNPAFRARLWKFIHYAEGGAYHVAQWEEAYRYIFGQEKRFRNEVDAKVWFWLRMYMGRQ